MECAHTFKCCLVKWSRISGLRNVYHNVNTSKSTTQRCWRRMGTLLTSVLYKFWLWRSSSDNHATGTNQCVFISMRINGARMASWEPRNRWQFMVAKYRQRVVKVTGKFSCLMWLIWQRILTSQYFMSKASSIVQWYVNILSCARPPECNGFPYIPHRRIIRIINIGLHIGLTTRSHKIPTMFRKRHEPQDCVHFVVGKSPTTSSTTRSLWTDRNRMFSIVLT